MRIHNEPAWVDDRRTSDVTAPVMDDLPKDGWPYAVFVPSPPMALGRVVCVCENREDADRIVEALTKLAKRSTTNR